MSPIHHHRIEELLLERGYRLRHETTKKRRYKRADQRLPIFVNLTNNSGATALVVHPETPVDPWRSGTRGVRVSHDYYHSSNMRGFPKRMHTGATPIAYGWGLTFESEVAFEAFMHWLETGATPTAAAAEGPPDAFGEPPPLPPGADLDASGKRRHGHDAFRDALDDYWRTCAVSGLRSPGLLVASHIKRWTDGDPHEKTDPFNGLLLAAHLDAAFERGLISFNDDGYVLLSPKLPTEDRRLLGLSAASRLRKIDPRHRPYLAEHRRKFFPD